MSEQDHPESHPSLAMRDIVDRLATPDPNPVRRARILVEREVPVSRRGPGWERHWRELEAYMDDPTIWSGGSE